jgi:hypothetical protein
MNAACKYVRLGAAGALIREALTWFRKRNVSAHAWRLRNISQNVRVEKLRNPPRGRVTASGTDQILMELGAEPPFIGRRCNAKMAISVTQPTQAITLP